MEFSECRMSYSFLFYLTGKLNILLISRRCCFRARPTQAYRICGRFRNVELFQHNWENCKALQPYAGMLI